MALSYAPFDDKWAAKPPVYKPEPQAGRGRTSKMFDRGLPVSDDTECNKLILGFVASIIFMNILDSLRR
jgi:hypothetical protein